MIKLLKLWTKFQTCLTLKLSIIKVVLPVSPCWKIVVCSFMLPINGVFIIFLTGLFWPFPFLFQIESFLIEISGKPFLKLQRIVSLLLRLFYYRYVILTMKISKVWVYPLSNLLKDFRKSSHFGKKKRLVFPVRSGIDGGNVF